jgi:hypothetical protein
MDVTAQLSTGKVVTLSVGDATSDDAIRRALQEKEGIPADLMKIQRVAASKDEVKVLVRLDGGF